MDKFPRPTGELQGDDKAIPDRGVTSGVTDTYGCNLAQGYDNLGKFNASSDKPTDKAK